MARSDDPLGQFPGEPKKFEGKNYADLTRIIGIRGRRAKDVPMLVRFAADAESFNSAGLMQLHHTAYLHTANDTVFNR